MSHSAYQSHRSGDQISRSRECDKGVFVTVAVAGATGTAVAGAAAAAYYLASLLAPFPPFFILFFVVSHVYYYVF